MTAAMPGLRGVLGAIRRKRSKDTIVLSIVIAGCLLFLFAYRLGKPRR